MQTMLSSGLAARLFIDHIVLVVSDIGRTEAFYSMLLAALADDPDKIRIEFFIYA